MPWPPSGISPPVESQYKQSTGQQSADSGGAHEAGADRPLRNALGSRALRRGAGCRRARPPTKSCSTCWPFPINPADMWFCRGSYRLKPPLPATPGAECVGRVTAVGAGVKHVKTGDLVINLQRENWAQTPQGEGRRCDPAAGRHRPQAGGDGAHQPADRAADAVRLRRPQATATG